MKVLQLVLLICLGVVLLSTTSHGVELGVVSKLTCLNLDIKRPIPVQRLMSYFKQKMPIEAILFTTKKNLKICADPELDWVKQAIDNLDKRKEAKTQVKKEKKSKEAKKPNKKVNKNKPKRKRTKKIVPKQ
ncbi:lymphotactin-like [Discoglossus pictus]